MIDIFLTEPWWVKSVIVDSIRICDELNEKTTIKFSWFLESDVFWTFVWLQKTTESQNFWFPIFRPKSTYLNSQKTHFNVTRTIKISWSTGPLTSKEIGSESEWKEEEKEKKRKNTFISHFWRGRTIEGRDGMGKRMKWTVKRGIRERNGDDTWGNYFFELFCGKRSVSSEFLIYSWRNLQIIRSKSNF